ncbi:translation initiation factor IF-2 [Dendroctonus ponderosae]|uniref:translation initiation factor IF-2 n=1 Tax=Dendroctonus ponderosae TaxID=77166 RepID=UPI00203575D4|nr:translation initiation factor IF-2 [Dendroctonus ponderosae]
MCSDLLVHYQRSVHSKTYKMFHIVAFWAFAACQLFAANGQVAVPVAAPVVTARSSQYFAQTHSALAAPLVQPVAPVAQYFAPSAASVSQVTRYAQYLAAPYLLPAPLLASPAVAPLVATSPVAAPAPAPQQPPNNPDAEAVEVESARLRAAPAQQAGKAQPLRAQKQQVALLVLVAVACVAAAPKPSVPVLAPAIVTAQSSQVIARNYNALAAPLIAPAPIVRAAPVLAPAPVVRAAPFAAPYWAAPAPYLANPYAAPLIY